jgi:hypothetical protein
MRGKGEISPWLALRRLPNSDRLKTISDFSGLKGPAALPFRRGIDIAIVEDFMEGFFQPSMFGLKLRFHSQSRAIDIFYGVPYR